MESYLLIFAVALAAAAFTLVRGTAQSYRRRLRDTAARLGLRYVDATWTHNVEVVGEIGGYDVHLKRVNSGEEQGTRVRVSGLGHDLQLHTEGLDTTVAKALGGEDIQIGVPAVDRHLRIRASSEAVALAVLGRDARERAVELVRDRGTWVKGGEVIVMIKHKEPEAIAGDVARAAALAKALDLRGTTVRERLLEGLREDPVPGYRLRCLEVLIRGGGQVGGPPSALEAAGIGLDDSDPRLRLLAARRLERADVLEALLDDRTGAPWIRAEAALALVPLEPRAVSAREPALIGLLSPPDREASLPAVEALEKLGSVEAVAALQNLAEARGTPKPVKMAARGAVEAIQGRLGGASRGGLAVVDPATEGALSTAESEGGLSEPGGSG